MTIHDRKRFGIGEFAALICFSELTEVNTEVFNE